MPVPTKTWKSIELKVAKLFKGKRNHFEAEDVKHDVFSVEVKHRKKIPAYLHAWIKQAQEAAPKDKWPVLVWHEHNQRLNDSFVVLRLEDFIELIDSADLR